MDSVSHMETKLFSAVLTFVTVVMNAPQTNIIGLRNALKLTEKK